MIQWKIISHDIFVISSYQHLLDLPEVEKWQNDLVHSQCNFTHHNSKVENSFAVWMNKRFSSKIFRTLLSFNNGHFPWAQALLMWPMLVFSVLLSSFLWCTRVNRVIGPFPCERQIWFVSIPVVYVFGACGSLWAFSYTKRTIPAGGTGCVGQYINKIRSKKWLESP